MQLGLVLGLERLFLGVPLRVEVGALLAELGQLRQLLVVPVLELRSRLVDAAELAEGPSHLRRQAVEVRRLVERAVGDAAQRVVERRLVGHARLHRLVERVELGDRVVDGDLGRRAQLLQQVPVGLLRLLERFLGLLLGGAARIRRVQRLGRGDQVSLELRTLVLELAFGDVVTGLRSLTGLVLAFLDLAEERGLFLEALDPALDVGIGIRLRATRRLGWLRYALALRFVAGTDGEADDATEVRVRDLILDPSRAFADQGGDHSLQTRHGFVIASLQGLRLLLAQVGKAHLQLVVGERARRRILRDLVRDAADELELLDQAIQRADAVEHLRGDVGGPGGDGVEPMLDVGVVHRRVERFDRVARAAQAAVLGVTLEEVVEASP
jgi:hypothetical protein